MPENRSATEKNEISKSEHKQKVRVPCVLPNPNTLGTDGTRIFRSVPFLEKWSLQKLNADETSGKSTAADIDFVGVLDVISVLILLKERAEALLRKAVQSIIIAPLFINGI